MCYKLEQELLYADSKHFLFIWYPMKMVLFDELGMIQIQWKIYSINDFKNFSDAANAILNIIYMKQYPLGAVVNFNGVLRSQDRHYSVSRVT